MLVIQKPINNPQAPPQGLIETSGSPAHLVPPDAPSGCVPENMRCRGCQSKGVKRDLPRPRCSNCLDEQILCFYVAPLRLTMARSKKQSVHVIYYIIRMDISKE